MTTIDIVISLVGFILCATVVALVGLVIAGIFWHSLVKKADFNNLEIEEWEEGYDHQENTKQAENV